MTESLTNPHLTPLVLTTDNDSGITPYDLIAACQQKEYPAACVADLIVRGQVTMSDFQDIGPLPRFEAQVCWAYNDITRR